VKFQTATTMDTALAENVHALADSKVVFVKKLIVSTQLAPTTAFALREHAFARKDGQDQIALKKIKRRFLVCQLVQTRANLIHTPKNVFAIPNSVETIVRWSFVI
jgi:hypothetical protein